MFFMRDGSHMDWKMDWDLAIKRNSEALRGIIAALFAMLGLDRDVTVGRIPHPLPTKAPRILPKKPCKRASQVRSG